MTDLLSWSMHLGRWAGVQVKVHIFFFLFAVASLLRVALDGGNPAQTLAWLLVLGVVLALHELGHAAMAARLGAEPEDIRLWPLGNLVGPGPMPSSRATESFWVALAGPATSLALALIASIGLGLAHAQMVWNPFGNALGGGGAPLLADGKEAAAFSGIWWAGWFGYLNLVVFVANLIPALPFDTGRAWRAGLASPIFGAPKDRTWGPHMARAWALILGAVGLFRLISQKDGALWIISIALLIEWMVRVELRLLEEGGFYDDGIFGYDFSEGYTSLEGSAQKVRPYRESALRRWRRRRSEYRRQRRLAREAAEEQRMDEILAKLHSQGRDSLTDDERRFLIRVSAKYRNRPKSRG